MLSNKELYILYIIYKQYEYLKFDNLYNNNKLNTYIYIYIYIDFIYFVIHISILNYFILYI
jgi:hypothetical protein